MQSENKVKNRQLSETDITLNDNPIHITGNKFGNSRMDNNDFKKSMIRQICIWTPIILFVSLYFIVLAIIDMPIQKNSILYAKYGTTKPSQSVNQ